MFGLKVISDLEYHELVTNDQALRDRAQRWQSSHGKIFEENQGLHDRVEFLEGLLKSQRQPLINHVSE